MSVGKIFLLSVIIVTLFVLPLSSAESFDNETFAVDDNQSAVAVDGDDILQSSRDYYFNASAENDNGDGSIDNPYKYLTSQRIKANCNIYLADGEYDLDFEKTIERVNIIGCNPASTILKYTGRAFTVNDCLSLTNITLKDISIKNYATLNATNTIFSYGFGGGSDYYGNTRGGAIYTQYIDGYSPKVTIVNSTFENNLATYGGAIYMEGGSLDIIDSQFTNNIAYSYGGAIACEYAVNITVSKSRFVKNYCLSDAGGAIYIRASENFKADHLDIINSSATFGGAITILGCDVTFNNINFYNNSALWDGGAIYHLYGKFTGLSSSFINNTARNGGALFIDNSTAVTLRANNFFNNNASLVAGAIYSLSNTITVPIQITNHYKNNTALYNDDIYDSPTVSLTIGDGDYDMYKINETEIVTIPSRYSLVDDNYLTPVKDQKNGGNCWAFTALAVLESCIKKATGLEFDFSEENMKNMMAMYSDYGWDIDANEGGSDGMTYGYLTSWLGPVLDGDDLYDAFSALSPIFNSVCHVQNILSLKRDNFTDNDAIKMAILKYGAVGTSMMYDDYYLNGTSYYTWVSSSNNHAVTIVGWDDDYSRYNFAFGGTIEGDGAWIVRNSWGADWGDGGYFYVSYYDTKLAQAGSDWEAYTFILNDTVQFDRNYQYDIQGLTNFIYGSSPNVFYKNKFTSTHNEMLCAVSTYFDGITNWTVSVLVNNVLKASKTGVSNTGYWTINLDEAVQLFAGDVFEIVFNTSNGNSSSVPVSNMKNLYRCIFSPETSYISRDGENWSDLFDYQTGSLFMSSCQVACIKAFTVLCDVNTTTSLDVVYDGCNPVRITVTVSDQYGNLVDGKVTLTLNGVEQILNLRNGSATVTHNFDEGLNNISAVFNQKGYSISSNSTTVEITKHPVSLYLNITRNINNVLIDVSAGENINETVIMIINNNPYSLKLKNGRASYRLTNLENGNYSVDAILKSNIWKADNVYDSFEVNVKDANITSDDMTTVEFSGEEYAVYLTDEQGLPVSKRNITFTLNNQKFSALTDDDGRASVKINLSSGNYTIRADFAGDDDFFPAYGFATIRVKINVTVTLAESRYQNNVSISINLSKPVNATLTLSINDRNYSVTVADGFGVFTMNGLENGNYTVTSHMDESYQYSSNVLEISIDVKNTQIIAQNLVTSDESFNYTVTLLDEDGNPLKGKEIEFTLGNATYCGVTDESGNASVVLSLVKGNNSVDISFRGDRDLFKTSSSSRIILKPLVTANIIVTNVVETTYIQVILSKRINQTAIICLDGQNFTQSIINGQAVLTRSYLKHGIHNVSVDLCGDEYTFTKTSINFNVTIKRTRIIADDFITGDYSGENYTVTLMDELGNPVADERITFILNEGIYFGFTNQTGQASVKINLAFGNYSILSRFSPSSPDTVNEYYGCENTSQIIVKLNVSSDISMSRTLRDVKVDITFTKPINDTVNVSLNGEAQSIKITNGRGVLNLSNMKNGDYTVSFNLDEGRYISPPGEFNFTVDVRDTRIIVHNIETYFGSGQNCEIQLVDQKGLAVKSAWVSWTIDGTEANMSQTDDEGKISIPINLKTGSHRIVIRFDGDNDHVESQALVNVTINPSIEFANNRYTLNSNYVALLRGNVNGMKVTVLIDGVQYMTTAGNGQISLNLKLGNGVHTIQLTNPATGEVRSQSIKVLPRLSNGKNIAMYLGANKVYSVKAYDDNGKLAGAGEKVVFKIAGKSYTAKTNKNGVASIKLNKLAAKTYKITATYKGYKVSNKITIKPTLITKNKSVKKGKTFKFTAKLLKTNGKAFKGKKITFKIKNKKYTAKTNKKGIATIKINGLKVGKYRITASYSKLTSKSTVTVKK